MRVRCGLCGLIYLITVPAVSTVSGVTHFEEQQHTCPGCQHEGWYEVPVENILRVA